MQSHFMKTKTSIVAVGSLLTALAAFSQTVTFTKITTGEIVNDQGQFVAPAWGDFRNSGFLDLVVANWGGRTNVYYRNNGDGTFTKISQGNPVADGDYHVDIVVGDYDNDGFLDMLTTSGVGAPTLRRNILYHGNGDGTFSRASGGGLTNSLGNFDACSWADFNNDGQLSVLIGDQASLNQFWRNEGDGVFTRIASNPWTAITDGATIWCDYDNDGFMDFLVAGASGGYNLLCHNNRDGTFTKVTTNAIATDFWVKPSEIGTWGDYDNDGLPDLFVTGDNGSPNRLYHNEGNGGFTKITNSIAAPMLNRPAGADSVICAWGDYDNDGYLDLFVSTHNGTNALYHNNGNGTFTQILTGDPVNDGGPYYSLGGWVDYDNDGFLDLFIARNNTDVPAVTNLLYHNNGNTNGWLEVKLTGTASNRSAIGAKVRVHATIGGKAFWQLREITTGGGRWVQPLTAHFGLGDATNIDQVRIEWPSGIVQVLTNVGPRQLITVTEHQQTSPPPPLITRVTSAASGAVSLEATGAASLLYVIEGSANLGNWTKVAVVSNATGVVSFTDARAVNYGRRFYRISVP